MHTSVIISAFFCNIVFPDGGQGESLGGILTVPSLGHLGDHLPLGWLLHQVSPWVRPSEKLWVFKSKKPTVMAPLSVVRTICCIAWVISRYQWHFLSVDTWDALIWMKVSWWRLHPGKGAPIPNDSGLRPQAFCFFLWNGRIIYEFIYCWGMIT